MKVKLRMVAAAVLGTALCSSFGGQALGQRASSAPGTTTTAGVVQDAPTKATGSSTRDAGPVTLGDCSPDCPGDLNGDRVVNGADLLILLSNWGECDQDEKCEQGFVCGDTPVNCDGFEGTDCFCFNGFDGDFVCGQDSICTDVPTCPNGACPPGYVCAVDTCCGEPVCLPDCNDPPVEKCEQGFECGGEIFNCEGFEGTDCFCFNGFDGDFVCGQDSICTDVPTCPNGACPPGYVCAVDTCCGEPVCLPDCNDPPAENQCDFPGVCGTYEVCGIGSPFDCLCWEINGDPNTGMCFQDFFCSDVTPCPPDGVCPPGFACVTDSCCGEAFCAPIVKCDDGGGSNCCVAHDTPGCDDPECEALICSQDPFCCDTQWDQLCADAALQQCAVCSGDVAAANPDQPERSGLMGSGVVK